MRRTFAVTVCAAVLAAAPSPLVAQWSVGLEVGASGFAGASFDTTGSELSGRPAAAIVVGLRADRRLGRAGVGLGVRFADAGLLVENSSVSVTQRGTFTLVEIAPELSFRLAATARGTLFAAHGGPLVAVWAPDDNDTRARVGAHAALSAEWPIAGPLAGSVRAGTTLTGSVFGEGDTPPQFERRAMWHHSVSLGLRYRL